MQSFDPSSVLAHVYTDVQRRFSHYHDLAHGWDHVRRVYELALHIAERENADRFIVGLASLMHDLGRTVEDGHNGHHADLSITLADNLLRTYQVPLTLQDAIKHAIIAHSFSKGITPDTLEACVVRDADRLDALGAVGIMRWGIVSEQRRTPTLQPYCLDDPLAERHQPDDHRYMLDHYYVKLLKIGETMCTETARALAEHRTSFMRLYLDEFKREVQLK
jgi:uncharacterized protein